jgi:hypothetical protein
MKTLLTLILLTGFTQASPAFAPKLASSSREVTNVDNQQMTLTWQLAGTGHNDRRSFTSTLRCRPSAKEGFTELAVNPAQTIDHVRRDEAERQVHASGLIHSTPDGFSMGFGEHLRFHCDHGVLKTDDQAMNISPPGDGRQSSQAELQQWLAEHLSFGAAGADMARFLPAAEWSQSDRQTCNVELSIQITHENGPLSRLKSSLDSMLKGASQDSRWPNRITGFTRGSRQCAGGYFYDPLGHRLYPFKPYPDARPSADSSLRRVHAPTGTGRQLHFYWSGTRPSDPWVETVVDTVSRQMWTIRSPRPANAQIVP